jgi:6-pyruvoyltetrahydropterin/6-carboxytetrahydropterin synthase
MTTGIRMSFDAAHYLPNHPKCGKVHGHTWTVEVKVLGPVNPSTGMVVDFSTLKEQLKAILSEFDHRLINDTLQIPTCENICTYIYNKLRGFGQDVCHVKVQEGEGGWTEL